MDPGDTTGRRAQSRQSLVTERGDDLTVREQIIQLYPAAVVTMRRVYRDLEAGEGRALRFVKRISQRLVTLSETQADVLWTVSTLRNTWDDPAGIAVNAAISSLLMARKLTDDFDALQRICFCALVAGRRRRSDSTGDGVSPRNRAPREALLVLDNAETRYAALQRAMVAYEVAWLANKHEIGWPWGDKRFPRVESLLIDTARRFWDELTAGEARADRPSPPEVFERLRASAETRLGTVVVDLLVDTLGYFEDGAAIETSTGWRGVIVEPAATIEHLRRPTVRMVLGPDGEESEPFDVDLSDESIDSEDFGVAHKRLDVAEGSRLAEIRSEVETGEEASEADWIESFDDFDDEPEPDDEVDRTTLTDPDGLNAVVVGDTEGVEFGAPTDPSGYDAVGSQTIQEGPSSQIEGLDASDTIREDSGVRTDREVLASGEVSVPEGLDEWGEWDDLGGMDQQIEVSESQSTAPFKDFVEESETDDEETDESPSETPGTIAMDNEERRNAFDEFLGSDDD